MVGYYDVLPLWSGSGEYVLRLWWLYMSTKVTIGDL